MDLSKIVYAANSPYRTTPQTSWHILPFVLRPIPPNKGDTLITLTSIYEFRPDRLSFDLYRTPAYWWVFCVRNPFLRPDPIWTFSTGLTITVPSASYLISLLGS